MASQFAALSAIELLEGYRAKTFSPVEVTRDLLAHAEAWNATLNAFYVIDHSGALQAARESEARWLANAPCGLLDGIPSSVKDALPSVGFPSYRGSAAHHGDALIARQDAPSIARMREAGAVFLGKTTMPDFGILASGVSSQHGVTRNPWNPARTPGGSSAGTAASIAAGISPLAVGTDIVGSIRLPASFCGLFGHKPSQGRVPYYFPNSPSLVAGPMARTLADTALLMNVITQPDDRDFTALPYDNCDYLQAVRKPSPQQCRIKYVSSLGLGLALNLEVRAAVDAAVASFAKAGFDVEHSASEPFPEDLRLAERFYKIRCRAELNTMPPDRQRQARVISNWSEEAESISAVAFYDLFNGLQKLRERTARLSDGADFIITPTVHIPAFDAELPGPDRDCYFAPFAYCFLFNLTEQPAISIPCGLTSDGLPIGLQIVGRRFDDLGVFRLAAQLQQLLPNDRGIDARARTLLNYPAQGIYN